MFEKERVYKFLLGLNSEFEQVCDRVLRREIFPDLDQAFSLVKGSESQKELFSKLNGGPTGVAEAFALVITKPTTISRDNQKHAEKDMRWCDFCKKPRHTRETCWKLHGKPANFKESRGDGKGFQVSTDSFSAIAQKGTEAPSFSKEQLDHLCKFLHVSMLPSSSSQVQKGNYVSALNASVNNSTHWIIDSGASDHMTGLSYLFSSYTPCAGNIKVRIADGSFASIAGKGSVVLSDSITLQSVLHVPKLTCNLLSISKLTRDLNCAANFLPTSCVFQDLCSGKMIGSTKEVDHLYLFEDKFARNSKALTVHDDVDVSPSLRNNVMLWHFRLGHPSFSYMFKLFPTLFHNKNPSLFQCEICQLSKHHRTVFPSHNYKASHPFYLIHSDIWGPSHVTNYSGTRWFITFIDDHTRLCWVYLLKDRSEATRVFQNFHAMVQTQFHTQIKILRTNNGTEYFNSILKTFLFDNGIIHQSTCVNTPQQNGIVERKNRHLLEVT